MTSYRAFFPLASYISMLGGNLSVYQSMCVSVCLSAHLSVSLYLCVCVLPGISVLRLHQVCDIVVVCVACDEVSSFGREVIGCDPF